MHVRGRAAAAPNRGAWRNRICLLLATALASCARPPADVYVGGASTGASLGADTAGEMCTLQGGDIFCGTWTQPSGHVAAGGPADAATLASLAGSGPWRAGIDQRLACQEPQPTTIFGDVPALLLSCTRKIGGWPQVALAASVNGTAYVGDAILPALPVLERSIGVMSGRLAPSAAAALPPSAADALMARRLAAQSFGAHDLEQFDALMQAGTKANLAQDFAGAEQAYRAAVTLQQRVLGAATPEAAGALTLLALQISDQGRFAEADALFAKAAVLAPRASDPAAPARLLHDRALHALNQGHDEQALVLLKQAETAYAALLPAHALAAPPPLPPVSVLSANGTTSNAGLAGPELVIDPVQQGALLGVIETRRYQAIVLRNLGRTQESQAAISSAATLAAAHDLRRPILTARLYRTAAATAGQAGESATAVAGLTRSSAAFVLSQPGTRPVAETALLHAGELVRHGDTAGAAMLCDQAVSLLTQLKLGTSATLIAPCLQAYDVQAGSSTAGQAELAKMFEAVELAQGSVTGRQIAEATARLAESARNPRVGEAIRRRQDADAAVNDLLRQRDLLAAQAHGAVADTATPPVDAATLDKRIRAAQAELADADTALQIASPNYGQLVQQLVPASDVLGALRPDEAFAAIFLDANGGWVLLARGGQITAAKLPAGSSEVATLVQRLRDSVEPGQAGLRRFDTDAASTLYADTLAPVSSAIGDAKALIVAPPGPLLSIPFGVLLTGPADSASLAGAPWLIRRVAIAHVPSAANFVGLRRIASGSAATRPWFGFGDFKPVTLAQAERSFPGTRCADAAQLFAGLPPLPFARRELAAAQALLGGSPHDELLGAAFTAPAVQMAALKQYRVLHFSAHALLPTDLACESEPAIVTSAPPGAPDASGAVLTASDVSTLSLDADAVVLSACNSGGPGGTAGESLSGLARAFFYAGARSMLVTHWSVNDQAAALLVADTLRRLRAGGGIAEALRGAELAILDDAGKGLPAAMQHPFYWAPFAVIGEGGARVGRAELSRDIRAERQAS